MSKSFLKTPSGLDKLNFNLTSKFNLFIMNVNNGNVHGFVGNGIIGEVVTIIATQRCTVHHAENGVAGASIYKDPRGRDVTMLANTSARFIYAGSYWVRMV